MAFTETIKTGRKYRKCVDNTSGNKVFERYSFWNKASDTEFNDGTTVESKLGSYKGVTTNENQVAGYAADVTLVKSIKTSLTNMITSLSNLVNSIGSRVDDGLGGLKFYEDSNGKWVVGADSVPKKLGSGVIKHIQILGFWDMWGGTYSTNLKTRFPDIWAKGLTVDNFCYSTGGASYNGPMGQNDTANTPNATFAYDQETGIFTGTCPGNNSCKVNGGWVMFYVE